MGKATVPDEGDVVWLNFTPQSGHEQAGHRPAVVLSPRNYNARTGLLVCVPITSKVKGYPFEVRLTGTSAAGVALADQVKNLDWKSRNAKCKGRIRPAELNAIKRKLKLLLKLD